MRKWVYLTLYRPGMLQGWKNIVQVWRKKASVQIVTDVDTAPSYLRNIIFPIYTTVPAVMAPALTLIGPP
ncbi:hypothetical protein [Peribacillus sp. NPDC101480]|uniref:hypothetical protein n=1 Tax=Peribacillus sp. NPDC101480 TaxID=3390620 RepID=UPI003D030870